MARFLWVVLVACNPNNGDAPLGTSRAAQAPPSAWLTPGIDYFCQLGRECTKAAEPGTLPTKHVICFGPDEASARDAVIAGTGHCFLSFPECEAARGSASSCQPY
ncbi:MAG: hypothetical protein QM831_06725 [Kofleriaceae bacterium]